MHVLRVPSSYSNFWWATSTLDLGTLTYFYMARRRKSHFMVEPSKQQFYGIRSFYSGAISQKGAEKGPCPPVTIPLHPAPLPIISTQNSIFKTRTIFPILIKTSNFPLNSCLTDISDVNFSKCLQRKVTKRQRTTSWLSAACERISRSDVWGCRMWARARCLIC